MAKKYKTTITDLSEVALEKAKQKCNKLETQQLDVTNKTKLKNTIIGFDLVICAVPGFLGFETLRSIIETGKNVIDISFSPENLLELDVLAKEKTYEFFFYIYFQPLEHLFIVLPPFSSY